MISLVLFAISCIFLTIYSYGFLDFNLTLSSNPLFLKFVDPLQHLIYFDRPHSVQFYVLLFAILFILYLITLRYKRFGNKSYKFPWKFIVIMILLLSLAYPMLSYDIYNYMFHAKILWLYHANPHLHAPLEYTGDLWLRFMRWVHTPSAYGPVFTVIESPAYLLGLGKFVPVLYLMKLTMSSFFVWCVYLVGRIGRELKWKSREIIQSQLILALNPFLLFELVINGHNDSVMIALLLLSLLYSLRSKKIHSIVAVMLSVGIKYMTALTLPSYLIRDNRHKFQFITLTLLLPILAFPGRFQPWYLVWALIPATLINTTWSRLWICLASISGLFYYVPYIYSGFWNNALPFVCAILYFPILITVIFYMFTYHPQGAK